MLLGSMTELLFGMYKALGSISRTTKQQGQRRQVSKNCNKNHEQKGLDDFNSITYYYFE